ncbi:MAG: enoyl-CoA hydratase/isomerase family protein [Brachymonas sp.]|nr:enoyl-CoA hydratase/isomerase family protein [Brachymonas sp.]
MAEILCQTEPTPGARVAHVALQHAGKFNAMSRAMWRQLRAVFLDLQAQTQAADPLRCVVVQGVAGHFCAGGDIAEYPSFRFDAEALRTFHEEDVWGALSAMLACDCPVVAAIDGNCMGAGLEIASCCDIRIATTGSRYGAPIGKLGFPMAPREATLLAHTLGETCARSILFEAALYSAPDMLQRGFLTRTVADADALQADAERTAARICTLGPASLRMGKQTFRALHAAGRSAPVDPAVYAYADSPEHREGIAAFMEKRAPDF